MPFQQQYSSKRCILRTNKLKPYILQRVSFDYDHMCRTNYYTFRSREKGFTTSQTSTPVKTQRNSKKEKTRQSIFLQCFSSRY